MSTQMIDDRRIEYVDEGTGEDVIVLLHAFPLDAAMWRPQLRDMSDRHRVIAPDLAGCGGSDPPRDPREHTIEDWADDVAGLLTTLGLEGVNVVGAVEGADVALALTRRTRDLVVGLVLAGLRPGPATIEEQRVWSEQADWIASGGDTGPIVDRLVDDLVPEDSPFRSEVVQLARWMSARTSQDGWVAGLEALASRPDPSGDLHRIDVPAIVITGEQDPIASPEDVRAMAAELPGGGVLEFERVGHLPNLEAPALFNKAVEEVVMGREARRSPGKHGWPASPAGTHTGTTD